MSSKKCFENWARRGEIKQRLDSVATPEAARAVAWLAWQGAEEDINAQNILQRIPPSREPADPTLKLQGGTLWVEEGEGRAHTATTFEAVRELKRLAKHLLWLQTGLKAIADGKVPNPQSSQAERDFAKELLAHYEQDRSAAHLLFEALSLKHSPQDPSLLEDLKSFSASLLKQDDTYFLAQRAIDLLEARHTYTSDIEEIAIICADAVGETIEVLEGLRQSPRGQEDLAQGATLAALRQLNEALGAIFPEHLCTLPGADRVYGLRWQSLIHELHATKERLARISASGSVGLAMDVERDKLKKLLSGVIFAFDLPQDTSQNSVQRFHVLNMAVQAARTFLESIEAPSPVENCGFNITYSGFVVRDRVSKTLVATFSSAEEADRYVEFRRKEHQKNGL